jgi:hypothetical protein
MPTPPVSLLPVLPPDSVLLACCGQPGRSLTASCRRLHRMSVGLLSSVLVSYSRLLRVAIAPMSGW